MLRPDFSFSIKNKVRVHIDFARKLAVISCETQDGKSLQLEATYETIDKLHQEIQKQLNRC